MFHVYVSVLHTYINLHCLDGTFMSSLFCSIWRRVVGSAKIDRGNGLLLIELGFDVDFMRVCCLLRVGLAKAFRTLMINGWMTVMLYASLLLFKIKITISIPRYQ